MIRTGELGLIDGRELYKFGGSCEPRELAVEAEHPSAGDLLVWPNNERKDKCKWLERLSPDL